MPLPNCLMFWLVAYTIFRWERLFSSLDGMWYLELMALISAQLVHNNNRNPISQLIKNEMIVYISHDTNNHVTYNNANAEERTKQLRNAKVEEPRIQEWSKTHLKIFQTGSGKVKRAGLEPTNFAL